MKIKDRMIIIALLLMASLSPVSLYAMETIHSLKKNIAASLGLNKKTINTDAFMKAVETLYNTNKFELLNRAEPDLEKISDVKVRKKAELTIKKQAVDKTAYQVTQVLTLAECINPEILNSLQTGSNKDLYEIIKGVKVRFVKSNIDQLLGKLKADESKSSEDTKSDKNNSSEDTLKNDKKKTFEDYLKEIECIYDQSFSVKDKTWGDFYHVLVRIQTKIRKLRNSIIEERLKNIPNEEYIKRMLQEISEYKWLDNYPYAISVKAEIKKITYREKSAKKYSAEQALSLEYEMKQFTFLLAVLKRLRPKNLPIKSHLQIESERNALYKNLHKPLLILLKNLSYEYNQIADDPSAVDNFLQGGNFKTLFASITSAIETELEEEKNLIFAVYILNRIRKFEAFAHPGLRRAINKELKSLRSIVEVKEELIFQNLNFNAHLKDSVKIASFFIVYEYDEYFKKNIARAMTKVTNKLKEEFNLNLNKENYLEALNALLTLKNFQGLRKIECYLDMPKLAETIKQADAQIMPYVRKHLDVIHQQTKKWSEAELGEYPIEDLENSIRVLTLSLKEIRKTNQVITVPADFAPIFIGIFNMLAKITLDADTSNFALCLPTIKQCLQAIKSFQILIDAIDDNGMLFSIDTQNTIEPEMVTHFKKVIWKNYRQTKMMLHTFCVHQILQLLYDDPDCSCDACLVRAWFIEDLMEDPIWEDLKKDPQLAGCLDNLKKKIDKLNEPFKLKNAPLRRDLDLQLGNAIINHVRNSRCNSHDKI